MTPPICSATGSIEDGIEEGKELGEIRTDVSAAIRNALGDHGSRFARVGRQKCDRRQQRRGASR
ncbi:hypothetical protein NJ7G_3557 [Natrinema sp. J7-2]|nr:hypothetical protein NJ7G_3557 [Natrinema sp. J7-2]